MYPRFMVCNPGSMACKLWSCAFNVSPKGRPQVSSHFLNPLAPTSKAIAPTAAAQGRAARHEGRQRRRRHGRCQHEQKRQRPARGQRWFAPSTSANTKRNTTGQPRRCQRGPSGPHLFAGRTGRTQRPCASQCNACKNRGAPGCCLAPLPFPSGAGRNQSRQRCSAESPQVVRHG